MRTEASATAFATAVARARRSRQPPWPRSTTLATTTANTYQPCWPTAKIISTAWEEAAPLATGITRTFTTRKSYIVKVARHGGAFRDNLYARLVGEQTGDGSWTGNIGPIYVTSINLTVMQLENGFLPIYQR